METSEVLLLAKCSFRLYLCYNSSNVLFKMFKPFDFIVIYLISHKVCERFDFGVFLHQTIKLCQDKVYLLQSQTMSG